MTFWKWLKTTNYNSGFGRPEIASDLIIVFKDGGFLQRVEYDGSERWDFYPRPIKPNLFKEIPRLKISEDDDLEWSLQLKKFI
jgi:hypothetical protein